MDLSKGIRNVPSVSDILYTEYVFFNRRVVMEFLMNALNYLWDIPDEPVINGSGSPLMTVLMVAVIVAAAALIWKFFIKPKKAAE